MSHRGKIRKPKEEFNFKKFTIESNNLRISNQGKNLILNTSLELGKKRKISSNEADKNDLNNILKSIEKNQLVKKALSKKIRVNKKGCNVATQEDNFLMENATNIAVIDQEIYTLWLNKFGSESHVIDELKHSEQSWPLRKDLLQNSVNSFGESYNNDNRNIEKLNVFNFPTLFYNIDSSRSVEEISLCRTMILSNHVRQSVPKLIDGALKWQEDIALRSPKIIEPFRKTPSALRNLVQRSLHLLEVHDSSAAHQASSPAAVDIYHQSVERVQLDPPLDDLTVPTARDGSSFAAAALHPKHQALQCGLGRHFEGVADALLHSVFSYFEDLVDSDGSEASCPADRIGWEHVLQLVQQQADELLVADKRSLAVHPELPPIPLAPRAVGRIQSRLMGLFGGASFPPLTRKRPIAFRL